MSLKPIRDILAKTELYFDFRSGCSWLRMDFDMTMRVSPPLPSSLLSLYTWKFKKSEKNSAVDIQGFSHVSIQQITSGLSSDITCCKSGILFLIERQFMF
jgi:hypothetical protein